MEHQAFPFQINKDLTEWITSYPYAAITPRIRQLSQTLYAPEISLAGCIIKTRKWLNDWVFDEHKQPIKRPNNILESRLISAEDIYAAHMSSCGSMSTLGATMLRSCGVPVKLIDGSHPKSTDHAWVEVYFPNVKQWLTFDFTGYGDPHSASIDGTYVKQSECHDWSELEPVLQEKYDRWLRRCSAR